MAKASSYSVAPQAEQCVLVYVSTNICWNVTVNIAGNAGSHTVILFVNVRPGSCMCMGIFSLNSECSQACPTNLPSGGILVHTDTDGCPSLTCSSILSPPGYLLSLSTFKCLVEALAAAQ